MFRAPQPCLRSNRRAQGRSKAVLLIVTAGMLMPMQADTRNRLTSPPDPAGAAEADAELEQPSPPDTGADEVAVPEVVESRTLETGPRLRDIVPIRKVTPNWPRKALQEGIEGFVELEFTIQPDGTVADVDVAKAGPGKLFVPGATYAILKWEFTPMTIDGQPVARRATQRFEFLLTPGTASVPIAQVNANAADAAFQAEHYTEAHKIYLHELAPTGDKYAQYMIGVMHVHGLGVPKDLAVGAAWLELAAEGGDSKLEAARDAAVAALTVEERRRKESLLEKLRGEYGDCAVVVRLLADDRKNGAIQTRIREREKFLRERCE